MPPVTTRGRLYDQAAEFSAALEALENAASQDMLAAWSDAYWAIRQDLDTLTAQVREARAGGQTVNRSWVNRQTRLRNVLDTAKVELARYAATAATATTAQQRAAIRAATTHADRLARTAVAESLPGLDVDLARTNPALLERAVGFLADGTPLQRHMLRTLPAAGVDGLRDVLVRGLTMGWGQDRMVREFTRAVAVPHARAVTILRTESLRVYRETSRASYAANTATLESWVWTCALDRRSCAACVVMHGTTHPVTETLDGHPRCRCAMVPRTRSWKDLGIDLPDDRPPLPDGKAWFTAQTPTVQRGILGPRKYDAWKAGEFGLDDVVARRSDPDWGTMRTERSLVAIRQGRDANWNGPAPQTPAPPAPPAAPAAPPAPAFRVTDYQPPWPAMDPEAWDDAMAAVNPRWSEGPEWQNNCTNCTAAYELRRRGFDVKAQSRRKGRDFQTVMADWEVPEMGAQHGTITQVAKALDALPDGARGACVVQWRGGGAHVFNWEVIDGEVRWIDAQPGRERTLDDLKRSVKAGKFGAFWVRLDDKRLSDKWSDYLLDYSTDPTSP